MSFKKKNNKACPLSLIFSQIRRRAPYHCIRKHREIVVHGDEAHAKALGTKVHKEADILVLKPYYSPSCPSLTLTCPGCNTDQ